MTSSLPRVAHEHHARLMQTVDLMPALGDAILGGKPDDLKTPIVEMDRFLSGVLVPHLDSAEATLYPELERMMQNRHSMTPMKREHTEIRNLAADFHTLGQECMTLAPSLARSLALRRVVFRLYALLKVHLAEEELYVGIVNKGVTQEAADLLAAALEHPIADPA
jgi:hypothetical protein